MWWGLVKIRVAFTTFSSSKTVPSLESSVMVIFDLVCNCNLQKSVWGRSSCRKVTYSIPVWNCSDSNHKMFTWHRLIANVEACLTEWAYLNCCLVLDWISYSHFPLWVLWSSQIDSSCRVSTIFSCLFKHQKMIEHWEISSRTLKRITITAKNPHVRDYCPLPRD